MPDLTFIVCRAHVVDGVEYQLSVYHGPTGFTAFWGCDQCRDEGGVEKRADSREEALARCERAIERHHVERHQASAALPPLGGI
jgi:hypothetical protein